MKRNLEIEKEEKEEIDNEDTKNEEIEIEIENEEIEKEGPIVSLHNRYVHTKTKRNLEIEKEEKGEEIENEEIKKEELEKEEIEKEGLIIKQERIVSLHDQYVHMVKECIRERYTKYYDVLTEDDILEVFVKTLKDSGVPPNIKKDPAYILFQIDFDELEIRRDLNLAALQNHYHAHGGPALNAAAMATPQVFRNWLDGVILNIPGVQANLGQDSFFLPSCSPRSTP